jgi:nicotinamidase-related amidase
MRDELSTKAALILIDIQQGFADPVWGSRNNPDAEVNAARLLEAWRESGLPLVHIQHRSTTPGSPLRPGQPGVEIQDAVAPHPGEPVMTKSVNSAFIGTGLEGWLRERGIDQLVIAGLTTNHCVETTTRMAGNLGFRPILVEDACATFDRTGPDGTLWPAATIHAVTLANLNGEFAEIATTNQILATIGSQRPST